MKHIITSYLCILIGLVALFPQSASTVACGFIDDQGALTECYDDAGIDETECNRLFTSYYAGSGGSYEFSSTAADCNEYETNRGSGGSTPAPPPDLSEDPADPAAPADTPFVLPDASVLNKLSASTPQQLIGNLLRAVTGVFGSIALIMVIYGGLTMMAAGAKSDQIKKGANIVLWACIGLVTLMASYAMVQFVISSVS